MKERILIKLSGEALMGNSEYGIDVSTINFICKEIKKIGDINLQARHSELSAEVYYKITELYESR